MAGKLLGGKFLMTNFTPGEFARILTRSFAVTPRSSWEYV